jgi:hypothetical protein
MLTIVFFLVFVTNISASYFIGKNFSANSDLAPTLSPPLYCPNNATPTAIPTEQIITYIVKDGDSFWKIAEQVCNDGKLAESIRLQNNYTWQSLMFGDVIKVRCK